MSYGYAYSELLNVLDSAAPAKVALLRETSRRVDHGLLSIGLKIHCLDQGLQFGPLVDRLGGRSRVLDVNSFKGTKASLCLVLPPTGNVQSAALLLDCIGDFIGEPVVGNPKLQLQICSPGRLPPNRAALLAIAFYLGSDTLRRYELDELETTFSRGWQYTCGKRLVLYDADGDFDGDFAWWGGRDRQVYNSLPMTGGRTDLLAGTASFLDIENVNLVASLLIHAEHHGYWEARGLRFEAEMAALLERHLLSGLLGAPWVHSPEPVIDRDMEFFAALQELTAYAFEEAVRVKRRRLFFSRMQEIPARGSRGILQEVHAILAKHRAEITAVAEPPRGASDEKRKSSTRFEAD